MPEADFFVTACEEFIVQRSVLFLASERMAAVKLIAAVPAFAVFTITEHSS
jgi:hypothetical protein